MAATDNAVYALVHNFTRGNMQAENVINGFVRLMSMNEVSIKLMLSDDDLKKLDSCRNLLAESGLDVKTLREALQPLIPYLRVTDEEQKKYREFVDYLSSCDSATDPTEILKKALSVTVMPMGKLFSANSGMDVRDVWKKEMQEKKEEDGYHQISLFDQEEKTPKESVPEEKNDKKSGTKKKDKDVEKEIKKEAEAAEKAADEVAENLVELSERYRNLTASLLDVVKGQDQAVFRFIRGLFQGDLFPIREGTGKPRNYFFFFGPPGVGKTFLAETAAKLMGRKYMPFNMSEYSSEQTYEDLLGISDFYKKARKGKLTEFVEKYPDCVLLFDEFEKAHPVVIQQFLQVLGSGKLNDMCSGKDVSFERATLIFTSNVGKELYADRSVNLTTLPMSVILDTIRNEKNPYGGTVLSPEICSRIAAGNLIMFNHLSLHFLLELSRKGFDLFVKRMEEEHNCLVRYPAELPLLFLYHYGSGIDGRIAALQSKSFLTDELHELVWQVNREKTHLNEISEIEFVIDGERMEENLKTLFKQEKKSRFLLLAGDSVAKNLKKNENYELTIASNAEEAGKALEEELTGVLIDPAFGASEEDNRVMSVSDYDTEGVRFFHKLVRTQTDLPIYILDVKGSFSETDRGTFLQEGAWGVITGGKDRGVALARQTDELARELQMERSYIDFVGRKRVINYQSRQETVDKDGAVRIVFYDLISAKALDAEDRSQLVSDAERPKERFDDIIGAGEAKKELRFFIDYLKNPAYFLANGGKAPQGVLLYGAPGTGKTMLARAMAGEADASFLQITAANFMNKYVGGTEENIRKMFATARRNAPAIIFIDEIDAIGRTRTGSEFTRHTENALTTILAEMDGFVKDARHPVFVLAATNAGVEEGTSPVGTLDEALWRRFDRTIKVELPTQEERLTYLKMMIKKMPLADLKEDDLKSLAERTPAKSLAILKNILNQANRDALMKRSKITADVLMEAFENYQHGEIKEYDESFYKSTAYHETGHAVLNYLAGETPTYITIEARGDFGGYMQHADSEKILSRTREQLLARIRTSLAGRAAEIVFFGDEAGMNTGASGDLETATGLALRLIGRYGMMDGSLLCLTREEMLKSAAAADYLEKANRLLNEEMKKTIAIIEENRKHMDRIAQALLAKNRLTGPEFIELWNEDV